MSKLDRGWIIAWLMLVLLINGMLLVSCVMVAHSWDMFFTGLSGQVLGALLLFQFQQGPRK